MNILLIILLCLSLYICIGLFLLTFNPHIRGAKLVLAFLLLWITLLNSVEPFRTMFIWIYGKILQSASTNYLKAANIKRILIHVQQTKQGIAGEMATLDGLEYQDIEISDLLDAGMKALAERNPPPDSPIDKVAEELTKTIKGIEIDKLDSIEMLDKLLNDEEKIKYFSMSKQERHDLLTAKLKGPTPSNIKVVKLSKEELEKAMESGNLPEYLNKHLFTEVNSMKEQDKKEDDPS